MSHIPWTSKSVTTMACNLPALAWKIDQLLDDPARLATMRANAGRLARPHAARNIAAALLESGSGG